MNKPIQVTVPNNQTIETGRTVLWVSELPENVVESDLENFFSDFKDTILVIQINRMGRMMESIAPRNLTATVIFKDHNRADEARKALNLKKLRGKTVRIMWHEKDNSIRYNNTANLFVKGIPLDVKPREFYELFLQYGDIISAKLCEDEDGNHNGYGYVSYYSQESAEMAIKELHDKEVWSSKLEVAHFQKKNERIQSLTANKNLYVKNLPPSITDPELKSLFGEFGRITWSKVMAANGRKFAIVAYDQEESAIKAKEKLHNSTLSGEAEPLYVDVLQKKSDRKKILTTRIYDNNFRLNTQFKNCNLHIRNIPPEVNEQELYEMFSQYGEIKSVKIPKYILVTKVKNEFKEFPMSKGFGYVCFTEEQNAIKAIEGLNGKYFPKYESWKRPLIIGQFMPRTERKQMLSRVQQNTRQQFPFIHPFMNPYAQGAFGAFPLSLHPNMSKQAKAVAGTGVMIPPTYHQPYHKTQYPRGGKKYQHQPRPTNQEPQQAIQVLKSDDPDLKYLESLEDEAAKKDYLGEFLFKKIENHPIAQAKNFTIDTIGKITGMILGIEDLNEIVDITMNQENLTQRITEALTLLEGQNA